MANSRAYPKVWSEFERQVNGRVARFQIEDIPEDMWSTAVEFMLGNYIREDVWWVTAGTAHDPEAIEEYRVLLTSIIKQKTSLSCFLTEEDGMSRTLVGVNIAMLQRKGYFVEHAPPKSNAGLKSLRMFSEAMKVTTVYDMYDVDEYLMGAGLSVTPKYRKLGVAMELLKARMSLTKELGVKVSGGIFTSAVAQRSAELAGMECYYQTSYMDFGLNCDIVFDSDAVKYLKMFAIRVD